MALEATARPAATILLLRDGPSGVEVFMVVRHHAIDFASGALVFPGGRVEETSSSSGRDLPEPDRDGHCRDGLSGRRDPRDL